MKIVRVEVEVRAFVDHDRVDGTVVEYSKRRVLSSVEVAEARLDDDHGVMQRTMRSMADSGFIALIGQLIDECIAKNPEGSCGMDHVNIEVIGDAGDATKAMIAQEERRRVSAVVRRMLPALQELIDSGELRVPCMADPGVR